MSVTRYSAQREAVLKELSSRYDHPTAEDIYFSVKKEISNISLATIYRNLTFLSDNGKFLCLLAENFDLRSDFLYICLNQ